MPYSKPPGEATIIICVRGASRRLRTCLLSTANWLSGAPRERGCESVDPVDHDWVRGAAGADRRRGLLPGRVRLRPEREGGSNVSVLHVLLVACFGGCV